MTNEPALQIKQRHRDAAEDAYRTCFEEVPNEAWMAALKAGKHDTDPVAQAFARFEREHCHPATDDALREAVQTIIGMYESRMKFCDIEPLPYYREFTNRMRAALSNAPQAAPAETSGWIVGNGGGTQWRTWENGIPAWTASRDNATRYARREDAEAAHAEDEDAWTVVPYSPQAAIAAMEGR